MLVVDDPAGFTPHNPGPDAAAIIAIQLASLDPAAAVGTPAAVDTISGTVLVAGELPDLPDQRVGVILSRFDLDPGAVRGPISVEIGPGFFAPEAGTMAVDLTAGAGTVWQGGEGRPFAPSAGGDPGATLTIGETVRLEQRSAFSLANAGSDRLVALSLVVRVDSAPGDDGATPAPLLGAPPEGITTDRLVEQTLGWQNLPLTIDTVALSRVTLAPGAEATAVNGAHLFVVESGTLTVQDFARAYGAPTGTPGPVHEDVPAGPSVVYGAGDRFDVASRGGIPPAIANAGSEPAVALVVSIAQTGSISIDGSFPGWSTVEPLVVEDAARVGSFVVEAGLLGAAPIAISLVRADYEDGAGRGPDGELVNEAMIGIEGFIPESGARLLAVESGALNYIVGDPALHRRPDSGPEQVPAMVRLSQIPGEQLLVLAPGRLLTRNAGRGPSAVLILTIGPAPPAQR